MRVIAPFVGGSFGSKGQSAIVEAVAAALAFKTGRAVKLTSSVRDSILCSRRLSMYGKLRTAVNKEGVLLARDCVLCFDNGAFAGIGPSIVEKAANRVLGPYRYGNLRVKAYAVYTHGTSREFPCGRRAPGSLGGRESNRYFGCEAQY